MPESERIRELILGLSKYLLALWHVYNADVPGQS